MKNNDIHFHLEILNKLTIAHMCNELFYQHNINLVDYKPTCGTTLQMVNNFFCMDPDHKYDHQLDLFSARYEEEFYDNDFSEQMIKLGICDFFEKYFKGYSIDFSRLMAKKIKEFPSCDIIFNNKLTPDPFPCSIVKDPESGMIIRNFAGQLLLQNTTMVITDIEFLIVDKVRKIREGVLEIVK